MNDLNSVLIATTVLAIGGLGFYMYKSEKGEELFEFDDLEEDLEDYSSTDDDDEEEEEEEEEEVNKKNRTKRNRNDNSKTKKKRN